MALCGVVRKDGGHAGRGGEGERGSMRILILSCNTGEGHNSCATALREYFQAQGTPCDVADALGFTITFSESTEGNATNEVNQIQTWAAAGYNAVISMSSGSVYDQAETCDANNLLFVAFAAHPEDDDLPDLQALDSYLGAVGPSKYNEAEVGYQMAKYYIDQGYTDFAIFGGSIMFGAEQHAYRVGGMIAAMIENETGVPCAAGALK